MSANKEENSCWHPPGTAGHQEPIPRDAPSKEEALQEAWSLMENLRLRDFGKRPVLSNPDLGAGQSCPPAAGQQPALCLQLGEAIDHSTGPFLLGERGPWAAIVPLQEDSDSGLKGRSDGWEGVELSTGRRLEGWNAASGEGVTGSSFGNRILLWAHPGCSSSGESTAPVPFAASHLHGDGAALTDGRDTRDRRGPGGCQNWAAWQTHTCQGCVNNPAMASL